MLELLAISQLAAGDFNQAITSYQKLVAARPRSVEMMLGLGEAQLAAKSYDAAADTARRAQTLDPKSMVAAQLAVKIEVLAERYDRGLAKARDLQARYPNEPQGWILEGDVELARNNWDAAAAALRSALKRKESSATAQQLDAALRNAGDRARLEAFESDWLARHPKDAPFRHHLAGVAIREGKLEQAASLLDEILRIAPDSALALNDAAWVRARLKRPGAVDLAERANRLSPNQPLFLDTLASAYASEGNASRAVESQKKAVELAPAAPMLRLHLARLYVQAGDKSAARTELDALNALGDSFAGRDEVRELRSKL
jgi:putative PEP-CTERM system TPR-repeat lipoprotein